MDERDPRAGGGAMTRRASQRRPARTDRRDPYAAQVSLHWSDMDAYAHINDVQFLRLLETHASSPSATRSTAVERATRRCSTRMCWCPDTRSRYRPLGPRHAPVEIQMWFYPVGGAGFDVAYIVTDPTNRDGERPVYAVAETELALYDFASRSPRRMRPTARVGAVAVGEPRRSGGDAGDRRASIDFSDPRLADLGTSLARASRANPDGAVPLQVLGDLLVTTTPSSRAPN